MSEPERKPFRAGDHVYHRGCKETWVLACDEYRGEVVCCGWPESIAKASDCELVEAASDDKRIDTLRDVARACGGQWRGGVAKQQLSELEQAGA